MHTTRYGAFLVAALLVLLTAGAASATTVLDTKGQPGTLAFVSEGNSIPAEPTCATKEQIGKLLFFDKSLSYPIGRSCAGCHDPARGFADPNGSYPVSVGSVGDVFGNRNAPTVAYCSHSPAFHFDAASGAYIGGQFWDGRAATLSDQAKNPFLNPLEMNNYCVANVVDKVKAASYANLFKQVYGYHCFDNPETAFGMIADAIAAYERSSELNPFSSRFDQYLHGTEPLNRMEALGLQIFEGKGGCSGCHPSAPGPGGSPPLFTDFSYHNVGVPRNPSNPYYSLPRRLNSDGAAWLDGGLGGVLNRSDLMGKMKVPTLRNVALTAPYGHNGIFRSLRSMVVFCANRNVGYRLEPEVPENVNITGFGNAALRDREIDALVAFLGALSDGYARAAHKDLERPVQPQSDGSLTPAAADALAMSVAPNPFNPVTRIDFSVQGQSAVRVAVYDVSGRLVRSLVDESLPRGHHATTWDGTDARGAAVASGIYFIRLSAGSRTLVRKAVLAR